MSSSDLSDDDEAQLNADDLKATKVQGRLLDVCGHCGTTWTAQTDKGSQVVQLDWANGQAKGQLNTTVCRGRRVEECERRRAKVMTIAEDCAYRQCVADMALMIANKDSNFEFQDNWESVSSFIFNHVWIRLMVLRLDMQYHGAGHCWIEWQQRSTHGPGSGHGRSDWWRPYSRFARGPRKRPTEEEACCKTSYELVCSQ